MLYKCFDSIKVIVVVVFYLFQLYFNSAETLPKQRKKILKFWWQSPTSHVEWCDFFLVKRMHSFWFRLERMLDVLAPSDFCFMCQLKFFPPNHNWNWCWMNGCMFKWDHCSCNQMLIRLTTGQGRHIKKNPTVSMKISHFLFQTTNYIFQSVRKLAV